MSTNGRWGSRSQAPLGRREAGDGGSAARSGTAAAMRAASGVLGRGARLGDLMGARVESEG